MRKFTLPKKEEPIWTEAEPSVKFKYGLYNINRNL